MEIKYEAMIGENIATACDKMENMWKTHNDLCSNGEENPTIRCMFNDVEVIYDGTKTADELIEEFNNELDRRRIEFEASPEGIKWKKECEEARRIAEESVKEGILGFDCIDEAKWNESVETNNDPYGSGVTRYAARWANYMDARIANGEQLSDIADDASREADKEGITGFMYGCAVSILSQVWKHGEELRRWHNKKTQIHNEGDAANETGGVLNPAIMTIGK